MVYFHHSITFLFRVTNPKKVVVLETRYMFSELTWPLYLTFFCTLKLGERTNNSYVYYRRTNNPILSLLDLFSLDVYNCTRMVIEKSRINIKRTLKQIMFIVLKKSGPINFTLFIESRKLLKIVTFVYKCRKWSNFWRREQINRTIFSRATISPNTKAHFNIKSVK